MFSVLADYDEIAEDLSVKIPDPTKQFIKAVKYKRKIFKIINNMNKKKNII